MTGFELLLHIVGGVALLLWATRLVRTGILRAFGNRLRRVLGRVIAKRVRAFAIGIGLAALLQSATATALLAMSFAGSGLLQVAPGIALMLGADVGSTLVVQALSFDLSWLSPALLSLGVVLFLSSEKRTVRQVGRIVIGLGLMLLSLKLIVTASEPLRDSPTLQTVIGSLSGDPLMALLVAALVTWLAHSSVAMVLLIMSLAGIGVIPVGLGMVLVLGANVGSSLIPLALTAHGAPLVRRIPLGNLLFRLAAALLVLPFLEPLLPGLAASAAGAARQIANFHTAFNLGLALLFLPGVGLMARLTERLLPEPAATLPEGAGSRPSALDPTALDHPHLALSGAARELLRMADTVETMLRYALNALRHPSKELTAWIGRLDDDVDATHDAIKLYLAELSRRALSEEQSRRVLEMHSFAINLEHIGDIVEKSLLDLVEKKRRTGAEFSEAGWSEIAALHGRLLENMQLAITVFISGDLESARQLVAEKERFRALERQSSRSHLSRLQHGLSESIETSALHLDLLRDLRHINSHLASVAYPILDQYGELRDSRLKQRPRLEGDAARQGERDPTAPAEREQLQPHG
ncbi:MAG TPA: Na/Pi cotransporter family protein [Candidatus Competibacteraceae bacterium]|nr:Na/Pi cotransporter family protein [Candidatus Competibacteraceae bacterium]